jgi:sugar lactone lactonase YvrE
MDAPSSDGRYVATVSGPGRPLDETLRVEEGATDAIVDLGAGGSPAWAPDGSSMAFIQFTRSRSEYGLNFRDRLAIATAGTWQVRTLADVMVLDDPGSTNAERLPRLAWTSDGRAVYWVDIQGGHIVEIATGRTFDLPTAVNGCDDLQWQPIPG